MKMDAKTAKEKLLQFHALMDRAGELILAARAKHEKEMAKQLEERKKAA